MRRMVKESSLKLRRDAALSRSARLHASSTRSRTPRPPLQGGHRLRPRGVQPRRALQGRQAPRARSASPSPILQRRLASSPEAIYQSLSAAASAWRSRLREEQLLQARRRGGADSPGAPASTRRTSRTSTSARTPRSRSARRRSSIRPRRPDHRGAEGGDRDARAPGGARPAGAQVRHGPQVGGALRAPPAPRREMFDAGGRPRGKLVIFTEHRDTLNYLAERIRTLLGRPEAVVTIHGGMGREERRKAQEAFTHDKDVLILVATDAAGEGINLQRAHLMVNYDLPVEPEPARAALRPHPPHRPDRGLPPVEPRRRGDARGRGLQRLLDKLERQRKALGGQVFDVLGKVFDGAPAPRPADRGDPLRRAPEVQARLQEVVDRGRGRSSDARSRAALVHDVMTPPTSRASARTWSGPRRAASSPTSSRPSSWRPSRASAARSASASPRRYEITHVPADVRTATARSARAIRSSAATSAITFEKELIASPASRWRPSSARAPAARRGRRPHRSSATATSCKRGTVLVDERDPARSRACSSTSSTRSRTRARPRGERRVVSRRLQFVELRWTAGTPHAPTRPTSTTGPLRGRRALGVLARPELRRGSRATRARRMATPSATVVPEHLRRSDATASSWIDKTRGGEGPPDQGDQLLGPPGRGAQAPGAGRASNARLNSPGGAQARRRARPRLEGAWSSWTRRPDLAASARGAGRVRRGAAGLLAKVRRRAARRARAPWTARPRPRAPARSSWRSSAASASSRWTASRQPRLRHRKPRPADGPPALHRGEGPHRRARTTITVTKNEILTSLNKPDDYILAIVEFLDGEQTRTHYVRQPFRREPDFGVTSVNYALTELLARAEEPA
ncbi:MAG: hypothetical protein KatS3mg123_1754 [Burkholderiales bacterium]|nr:MAG: hypothetical protein KatS3mg123_1754 [Burkholderiales bacterium]